ncbi:MAG: argininosuccinate synthase [Nanoarchaeota archaeon]|nr:argininosuccinate synthase [Nanoarchaeota archaeon]
MMKEYKKISSYEAEKVSKVVLLYSGGLDTSCILKWIQEKYGAEVITLTFDLGQQVDDLENIKQKALKFGAKKAYVLDVKDLFAEQYLAKAIKANCSYQGEYHVSTISRYLMAAKAVEIAEKEGADAIAHGCTGKGNDQVRLEATALALNPKIKIIAPVREWALGRDEELEYAKKHGIEVIQKEGFPYSSDDNMWGVTWEGGEIEDNFAVPKIEKFLTMTLPEDAPDKPELLELGFEKGIPVSIDGKKMKLSLLITELNKIGGKHGVGLCYMVEDRLVGLKIRGVYEHPGAHILIQAHKVLEKYVCTRTENEFKEQVDAKWGYLCYGASWLDPLMSDLDAFINHVNSKASGKVKVKLYKGSVNIVGVDSPNGIYSKSLVTFNKDASYNQNCAPGFIEIFSLQMKMASQIKGLK